jgi:HlyD family secretion protein
MAKPRSSTGLIVFLILLAAGGGGFLYWKAHKDKGPEFYTAEVTRGEIVQTVTASGIIKPLLDVLVSSQISGYVTWWGPDFNATVKKGQLLATLLPTSYQAAVQSASGNLANAEANHDLQNVTLNRDKILLAKGLLAQSDYDTQAALVEEAAAQIQITQAALDTAKTNLGYCQITAPLDGFVIARDIDIGNSVAATLSSPTLYEIGADLTKMQIDASVAEADVGSVANGQDVAFTVDAYPNRQFQGRVYQVRNAPQTQQNVVIYDVMINVDNSDLKLKPGMTANASIVITRHPNVLRLANSALRFRMPDEVKVTTAPAAPAAGEKPAEAAAPVKKLDPAERRKAMQEIMQQAGFTFGGGPPSPEVLAKMQELAKAKGIELPERLLAGARANASDAPVFRNVYRLPGGNAAGAEPELLRVRIGITDGANTEILGTSLKEGDVIVTGVNQPSAAGAAGNAFRGGPGGPGGPGGRY